MQIETKRLILREMTAEDCDALYRVLADSDIMRHYPYTFDEKRVRGWIEKNIERYRVFGFGLWAVCLRDSENPEKPGAMIGDCGLTMQLIGKSILPEIGYHIRGDCQRMGYAKEAASAVRDWMFENLPFGELYSYMSGGNLPSQRTAMSVGMRWIDEFPDEANGLTKVFRITRDEWETMR